MAQPLKLHQPEQYDQGEQSFSLPKILHSAQLRDVRVLKDMLRSIGFSGIDDAVRRYDPEQIVLCVCAAIAEADCPGPWCNMALRGRWSVKDYRAAVFPHLFGQQARQTAVADRIDFVRKTPRKPQAEMPRTRIPATTSTTAPSVPKPADQQPTFSDANGSWIGGHAMDQAELTRRLAEAKARLSRQPGV